MLGKMAINNLLYKAVIAHRLCREPHIKNQFDLLQVGLTYADLVKCMCYPEAITEFAKAFRCSEDDIYKGFTSFWSGSQKSPVDLNPSARGKVDPRVLDIFEK